MQKLLKSELLVVIKKRVLVMECTQGIDCIPLLAGQSSKEELKISLNCL